MQIEEVIKIIKQESRKLGGRYGIDNDDIAQQAALKYLTIARSGREMNATYIRTIVSSVAIDLYRSEARQRGGQYEPVGRKAMSNARANAIIANQF
jgi:DNA-directed RNA polymerase specialized sigma24 family protein